MFSFQGAIAWPEGHVDVFSPEPTSTDYIGFSKECQHFFFEAFNMFVSLCLVRSFEAAKTNLTRIVPRLQGPFLSNPNLLIILTY
jgi:hypothetical protein